jgi:quaternary ammonium compound-resistance protein SugE
MAWLILVLAGLFEIGFTLSLKYSENFTHFWPSVSFLLCAGLSFGLLTRAIKEIPLGTAYAVWTSIGAVGTALMGIVLFGEPASAGRLALLLVMVGAVVGLKLIESDTKASVKPEPAHTSDTRRAT